ncbi:MAG: protein YgfX [Sideroxydans sp.]|jgi:hypothetical protein
MSASLQRHYKLRSSSHLTLFISIACLLSLATLFVLPLTPMISVVFGIFVLFASAFLLIRDARLASDSSCVAFRLEVDNTISLLLRDGRHLTGKLGTGGVILPFVVLLNVRFEQGGHRGIVLLKDCMSADSFRRLRVVLRWGVKRQESVS